MILAWKLGIREGTRNPTMRIPSLQVNVIKESLAMFNVFSRKLVEGNIKIDTFCLQVDGILISGQDRSS
jgi:hypothetical protein